jgi:hypothetical protein
MSMFDTNEAKALKALDAAVSHHALAVANLEAHRLAPADPGDHAAIEAAGATEATLIQRIAIATGVIAHWRGIIEKQEAEAEQKAKAAAHAAEEGQAKADEKLVRDLITLLAKTAALRDAVIASSARTALVNANRGDRPGIEDAETRVRKKPGRLVPAIIERAEAFVDGEGNRVGQQQSYDAQGKVFWRKDLIPTIFEDVIRPAYHEAAIVPERFETALVLVDSEGRKW